MISQHIDHKLFDYGVWLDAIWCSNHKLQGMIRMQQQDFWQVVARVFEPWYVTNKYDHHSLALFLSNVLHCGKSSRVGKFITTMHRRSWELKIVLVCYAPEKKKNGNGTAWDADKDKKDKIGKSFRHASFELSVPSYAQ